VEFCRGTNPIQAANWRPFLNAFGSVIVATTAVDRITPARNGIERFAIRVDAMGSDDALVEPVDLGLRRMELRDDILAGKTCITQPNLATKKAAERRVYLLWCS
jgi:hypothetical protein